MGAGDTVGDALLLPDFELSSTDLELLPELELLSADVELLPSDLELLPEELLPDLEEEVALVAFDPVSVYPSPIGAKFSCSRCLMKNRRRLSNCCPSVLSIYQARNHMRHEQEDNKYRR